jgi:DNA replication ATP-dependent helicase Dna2
MMMASVDMRSRLLAILAEEDRLAGDERGIASALGDVALEAKGHALCGLNVSSTGMQSLLLRCRANTSRFREGDSVALISGNGTTKARIRMITDGGRCIQVACKSGNLDGTSITMRQSDDDVSEVFRIALLKLSTGAPGWWLLDVLDGTERGRRLLRRRRPEKCDDLATRLCADAHLAVDDRFIGALRSCLEKPRLLGIQGPPGTGKTVLLALAAEGLARQGLRVAITAHTHQAVNNALSTMHSLFPERRVSKLGNGARREGLSDDVPCVILKDEFGSQDSVALDSTVFGLTFASATIELSVKQSLFAPHAVLVDEAGQLPLPYAGSMGLMGASSYLVFGDDRQMPPVFRVDQGARDDAVSVFAQFRKHHPEHVVQLEVTHRLNEQLCAAVSRMFYEEAGLPAIRAQRKCARAASSTSRQVRWDYRRGRSLQFGQSLLARQSTR